VSLHIIGKQSGPEVTQVDLENIVSLKNQIERLAQMRDRLAESVLRRMNAGADVECGPRTADRDDEYRGPVRKQTLVVR
jgi:hypothetical protein